MQPAQPNESGQADTLEVTQGFLAELAAALSAYGDERVSVVQCTLAVEELFSKASSTAVLVRSPASAHTQSLGSTGIPERTGKRFLARSRG